MLERKIETRAVGGIHSEAKGLDGLPRYKTEYVTKEWMSSSRFLSEGHLEEELGHGLVEDKGETDVADDGSDVEGSVTSARI